MKEKGIRIMIYIEPELKQQADKAAEKDMRSFSNYVAVAVKEKLERDQGRK